MMTGFIIIDMDLILISKIYYWNLNASAGASASVTAGLGASTRLGWTVQKKLTMDKQMNGRMDI